MKYKDNEDYIGKKVPVKGYKADRYKKKSTAKPKTKKAAPKKTVAKSKETQRVKKRFTFRGVEFRIVEIKTPVKYTKVLVPTGQSLPIQYKQGDTIQRIIDKSKEAIKRAEEKLGKEVVLNMLKGRKVAPKKAAPKKTVSRKPTVKAKNKPYTEKQIQEFIGLYLKANHPVYRKTVKTEVGKRLFESQFIKGINLIADDIGTEIHINPRGKLVGKRKDYLDGMQIIYFKRSREFEVSEIQAGPRQDKLYIYKRTKSLKVALKDFFKGNERKPIKIY
jgi:hypothetical protein